MISLPCIKGSNNLILAQKRYKITGISWLGDELTIRLSHQKWGMS